MEDKKLDQRQINYMSRKLMDDIYHGTCTVFQYIGTGKKLNDQQKNAHGVFWKNKTRHEGKTIRYQAYYSTPFDNIDELNKYIKNYK